MLILIAPTQKYPHNNPFRILFTKSNFVEHHCIVYSVIRIKGNSMFASERNPLERIHNLIKHALQPSYFSWVVRIVIVTKVEPAPTVKDNRVKMVLKCKGVTFFINDPDPLPASTGTTGVDV